MVGKIGRGVVRQMAESGPVTAAAAGFIYGSQQACASGNSVLGQAFGSRNPSNTLVRHPSLWPSVWPTLVEPSLSGLPNVIGPDMRSPAWTNHHGQAAVPSLSGLACGSSLGLTWQFFRHPPRRGPGRLPGVLPNVILSIILGPILASFSASFSASFLVSSSVSSPASSA